MLFQIIFYLVRPGIVVSTSALVMYLLKTQCFFAWFLLCFADSIDCHYVKIHSGLWFFFCLFEVLIFFNVCFFSGLPKMQVIRNYNGFPQPAAHDGPPLHIQIGDTIELIRGDAHSLFWQVLHHLANGYILFVQILTSYWYIALLTFLILNNHKILCGLSK